MMCNQTIAEIHGNKRLRWRDMDSAVRTSRLLVFLCSCLPAIALVVGGCASGPSNEEQYFILETVRQGSPAQPADDGSLQVHRFSVDAAFAVKNLIYRLGESKYETDYYRRFLISPGTMIAEKTRAWLTDSGLFPTVLPVGSRVVPTYTLEGNVTALYGDFSPESTPTAVMEIRFFLVKNAEDAESILFSRTYRAASAVPSQATRDFIDAMNRSLAEILTRLEADLPSAFAPRADSTETPAGR
jgi:cholesterol transport system auxiliary component